jgi:lipopolysaccharide export system protein LptA
VKKLLFIAILLFKLTLSWAQEVTVVEILSADNLNFVTRDGESFQRLIGNVAFKHDSTTLYCDSAYFFDTKNKLIAFDNVRMVDVSSTLTCDTLKYNGNTKIAEALGSVILNSEEDRLETDYLILERKNDLARYTTGGIIYTEESVIESVFGLYNTKTEVLNLRNCIVIDHPDYLIYSDTMTYFTRTEVAIFNGPTEITGEDSFIECRYGVFDMRNEIAQFSQRPTITGKEQKITGDSIYYNGSTGLSESYGNVIMIDITQKITIEGQFVRYREKEGRGIALGKPLAIAEFEKDSLFLHADTLQVISDSSDQKALFAFPEARFYKSDLQGVCDSLVYTEADSTLELFRNPVIWSEQTQVSADSLRIFFANDKPKRLRGVGNSFMISEKSPIRYDQIKGRTLDGYFDDFGNLRKLIVKGNGETIYFGENEEDKIIGMDRTECSEIHIWMSDGELDRISFINKPKGIFYPLREVNSTNDRLKDFMWLIDLRPLDRYDVYRKISHPNAG